MLKLRSSARASWALSLSVFGLLATAACSSATPTASGAAGTTGSVGTSGSGGAASGSSGSAGTTSGGAASAGAASGGAASGGTTGSAGATSGGSNSTGGAGAAGGSGVAGSGAGGSGGAAIGGSGGGTSTACGTRALSLSTNATGSAADTAYAHLEIDMKTDLPIANSKRTVEFWALIKTTDWVGEKNELYYYGGGATAAAFGLDFGTNPVMGSTTNHATLNPFTNGGFTEDSTKDLGITSATDQWVHIAMVWDATNLLTYVNGALKITTTSTAVTALATAQSVLILGCNPTNQNCFNGNFSEFRVWNVARSATDIQSTYKKSLVGNEAGLVGYWKLDEPPGAAVAADSVTTGGHTAHPGTLKASTTALPTFVTATPAVPLVCP